MYVNTQNGVVAYEPNTIIPLAPMAEAQFRTIFVSKDRNFLKDFPHVFALHHPYPNPCRPKATIHYTLPYRWEKNGWLDNEPYRVSLIIYDARGRAICELVNRKQGPGKYKVVWQGKSDTGRLIASGTYLVRLIAGKNSSVQKIIMLR
jgi:hypothetical protein